MNVKGWLAATRAEDTEAERLRKTARTIGEMRPGEVGYTTAWAFSEDYPVWDAPCKTMDTAIQRIEDGWIVLHRDPSPADARKQRRQMLRASQ